MTRFVLPFCLAALLAMGCNGGPPPTGGRDLGSDANRESSGDLATTMSEVDGGAGHFSCVVMTAGFKSCVDYSWTGTVDGSALEMGCRGGGGVVGTVCDRQGAIGGCTITSMVGSGTVASTVWFFAGMPDTLKMICQGQKGTWVNP